MDDGVRSHHPGSRPGTVLIPQGALVRGPAFLLDSFLVTVVTALVLGDHASLNRIVLVTLATQFAYFAICEGVLGTTPGKRIFGLRVVRASDGRRCGPFAAIVRTVLRLVDNMLFSLPGITAIVSSPRRQRLGDRAAKTLVVSEVPEQVAKMLGGLTGGAGGSATAVSMLKRLNEMTRRQAAATSARGGTVAVDPSDVLDADVSPVNVLEDDVPCPFCDEPMSEDEIVCRHCHHYVNQVSAHGETEHLAPAPQLFSESRHHRFDALWRLVFAADEESLAAVREAVPTWPRADRLLAVHAFSEVDDPRTVAFLAFMRQDLDPAVKATAHDLLVRSGTNAAT